MSFVASTASNFKSLNSTAETDVGVVRIVNVAITSMGASGEAVHEFVEQDAVVINGIDYEFDISLNLQQSCNLLNSFDVSGNGPNDGFAVQLAADAGAGVSGRDMLANILADALDAQATASAGSWAAKALGGSEAGDKDEVKNMIQKDLWMGLVDVIRSDGLINTVEDVLLRSEVTVTIEAAAAAADCADELAAATAVGQAHRNILFTQLPQGNFAKYMDASEDTVTGALPMKDGDIITFVFEVDMPAVVPATQSQVSTTNTAGDANAGTNAQAPAGYVPTGPNVVASKIYYDLGKKRLALNLQVHNAALDGEALPVSEFGAAGIEAGKLRAATFRPSP
jgi:hypothetical protein